MSVGILARVVTCAGVSSGHGCSIEIMIFVPAAFAADAMSGIATDQNNAAATALLDNLTWWAGALKAAKK